VDKITVSGKSRTGTKSNRVLELKNQSNKTLCELGIGEDTSHTHKNYRKNNAKDLARIGLGLKGALDLILDNMMELATIGTEYNIWFELALTIENGIKSVLDAAAQGKMVAVHHPPSTGKARLHTVPTPELK
ncbi:hypothetical protein BGZ65_001378, partial [Modicella reniformis]